MPDRCLRWDSARFEESGDTQEEQLLQPIQPKLDYRKDNDYEEPCGTTARHERVFVRLTAPDPPDPAREPPFLAGHPHRHIYVK